MEIKYSGNNKTSVSTKKTGQDGCQVCAKNNSLSPSRLLLLHRISFSSFSPPLAALFLVPPCRIHTLEWNCFIKCGWDLLGSCLEYAWRLAIRLMWIRWMKERTGGKKRKATRWILIDLFFYLRNPMNMTNRTGKNSLFLHRTIQSDWEYFS